MTPPTTIPIMALVERALRGFGAEVCEVTGAMMATWVSENRVVFKPTTVPGGGSWIQPASRATRTELNVNYNLWSRASGAYNLTNRKHHCSLLNMFDKAPNAIPRMHCCWQCSMSNFRP